MLEDRSDLMVFIDLGFILLVGFLMLTETLPREIVALPGGAEDPPTPDNEVTVFNVLFDASLRFLVETEQGVACEPEGLEALTSCMTQLSDSSVAAVFMLVPRERATVQDFVSLLDLCRRNGWRCTVRS